MPFIDGLQILLIPFMIALIIGSIIYFQDPHPKTLAVGIVLAFLGLLSGVKWVDLMRQKRNTSKILSALSNQ